MLPIPIRRTAKSAVIPVRSSIEAAGYDLSSPDPYIVDPNSTILINLKIQMAIPKGFFGKIEGRSGLALKGMTPQGGVIDSDYRGEVAVILTNHSLDTHWISVGDRIAQLIILKLPETKFTPCESLPSSIRGNNGFGESGMKALPGKTLKRKAWKVRKWRSNQVKMSKIISQEGKSHCRRSLQMKVKGKHSRWKPHSWKTPKLKPCL